MSQVGKELTDVPFGQMIQGMGLAIAEAQYALDEVGIRLAQMMSGEFEVETVDENGDTSVETREAYVTFDGEKLSLLELGFTPTFYQFVDTQVEIKVSITITTSQTYSRKTSNFNLTTGAGIFKGAIGATVRATSVSSQYSSKYQYSAEGSSLMRTKIVPVPSPAVLEDRIRGVLERKQAEKDANS